jgi:hypothetical protein
MVRIGTPTSRAVQTTVLPQSPSGCGGRAGKVELLTGIEGASSRPVRRIVLVNPVLTGHCL